MELERLSDGGLTIGAFGALAASLIGLLCGFSVLLDFVLGFFPGFSSNFFGFASGLFSVSFPVLISSFLSLTIAFVSIFGSLPVSLPNGKTTGTNFLFVMPSGVSLMFFSNLGVWLLTVWVLGSLGSSVKVLSLSESTSNEFLYLADLSFYKVSLVCDMVGS